LNELCDRGRAENLNHGRLYEELIKAVKPDDLATIIFTSGTTGRPKGVMLTHANFMANAWGAGQRIHVDESDLALSFLPLSHVFERLAGYYFMISRGARIAYAKSMQTVAVDIQRVRPTVAAAVPRFYEKIYAKIVDDVHNASPTVQALFRWSVRVGNERGNLLMAKRTVSAGLKIKYAIAKALVFGKLKRKLGGRIRFFISGGAPLIKELGEFFYAANVLILEGYGLTETSPVTNVNSVEDIKFGTVGQTLPNVEVRIAADGEILSNGEIYRIVPSVHHGRGR